MAFSEGTGYHYLNVRVNSANDVCILCGNFMKFGPVTSELTVGYSFVNVRYDTAKKLAFFVEYLLIYWTDFRNESALRTDDGFVPYFSICQGTLPWQPNNFAVIQAN